jgi:hypothetical protein
MNDLNYLVRTYYGNGNSSAEASSHWQKYQLSQKISYKRPLKLKGHEQEDNDILDTISISGEGFGDFKKLNLFNLIISIHIFFILIFMHWHKLKFSTLLATMRYSLISRQVFGYDLTRMALTVDFLEKTLGSLNFKTITIIGDGYGRLGCILKSKYPKCKIISINLGKTLLFDYFYSCKVFPGLQHKLAHSNKDFVSDFNYVEAERYKSLTIESDLFINIASMQEMNYEQINDYFSLIKNQPQSTMFYCCNRLAKSLPDDSLISFNNYPWKDLEIIVDELCPWYQKFPSIKPPFIRKFDGPIQHRIVKTPN